MITKITLNSGDVYLIDENECVFNEDQSPVDLDLWPSEVYNELLSKYLEKIA